MKLFIHVGYPKAASSTLQHGFLNLHPQINLLSWQRPKHSYKEFENNEFLAKDFKKLCFSKVYEKPSQETKDAYNQNISADFCNIFSSEYLTLNTYIKNEEKAKRIHYIYPEAQILIIIRNQTDIIRSFYDMHDSKDFNRRFDSSVKDFTSWLDYVLENSKNTFLEVLYYDQVIDSYKAYFGKDNVSVFVMEDLRDNASAFYRALASYLNITLEGSTFPHASLSTNSYKTSKLERLKQKYFPKISIGKMLGEQWKSRLLDLALKNVPIQKSAYRQDQKDIMVLPDLW